jgi:hypothetical protein
LEPRDALTAKVSLFTGQAQGTVSNDIAAGIFSFA